MRFWDSSAVVPLVCREPESPRCRAWLREDPVLLVWALAATEVVSALRWPACAARERCPRRAFAAAADREGFEVLGVTGAHAAE